MQTVTPSTQSRVLSAPSVRTRTLLLATVALIGCSLLWFAIAVQRPLANPDEGRYAEIPRELLASGDWITPHLNGLAYLEKPPLQYWATALTYQLFGVSEWTARLWTLLAAWLDVVLVYGFARRVWGSRVATIAGALLASSVLHFAMGQILTLDMAFTLLLTATLCSFCMAQVARESAPAASGRWMLATWVLLACAVLTKGIAAILITGAVLSIYIVWQRDWAVLRTLRPIAGVALFLAVTAPWFIQVSRANPDFLQFFFVREHFERYLTDVEQRIEPWWYFVAVFAAGALPWLPQMASALLRGWRASAPLGQFDLQRLLWLWCAFVLVFFSLSSSKLSPYILPMFPPLVLLAAVRQSQRSARGLKLSVAILLLFAIILLTACLAPTLASREPAVVLIIEELRPLVALYVLATLAIAGAAWRAIGQQRFDHAVLGIAAASFLGLALLFGTVGHEPLRSGRTLAAQIPAELAAHAPIYSVQTYDQTIPFYLRRAMILADSRGELDYGLRHAPEAGLDMPEFEKRWLQSSQAVAIMPLRSYSELSARGLPMRVLGQDKRRIAVSRR
jgi:4-amino-4-deoxy-L-arabinose transferase-like glycosyltransferase